MRAVVIPIVSLLLAKVQASSEDVGLLQTKAALRDAMNRRFANVKTEPNLTAATLLHPRFKEMYFSTQEKEAAKGVILTFLRHRCDQAATEQCSGTAAAADERDEPDEDRQPSTSSATTSSGLWDDYDTYRNPDSSDTNTNNLDAIMENYLREPRINRTSNIFADWSCSQFPALEPAARKYLSAPPTSVASDQLFSAAGQLYADRRSNLAGENAEKLLFLAYNIRLFNFDY